MVRSSGGWCENVAFVCVCLGDMEEEVRLVGLVLCVCERILVLESLSVNLNVFKTDKQRLQYITTQSCSLYVSLSSQNTVILKKKARGKERKGKAFAVFGDEYRVKVVRSCQAQCLKCRLKGITKSDNSVRRLCLCYVLHVDTDFVRSNVRQS